MSTLSYFFIRVNALLFIWRVFLGLFVSKMCLKKKINQSLCLKIVKYITRVVLLECEREVLKTARVIFLP